MTDPRSLLTALLMFATAVCGDAQDPQGDAPHVTHGPILGRVSAHGIGVWVRTSEPARVEVSYRAADGSEGSVAGSTRLEHDNTGYVLLDGLVAGTEYTYAVSPPDAGGEALGGSFHTLPSADDHRNAEHNPRGLFNLRFEHGTGNFQFRRGGQGHAMPAYRRMLEREAGRLDFQIMNGDFIYEAGRGTTVEEWRQANGVARGDEPEILRIAPRLAGVWENYKIYLQRSPELAAFHRRVPAFFMFDDHEILNDVNGTADVGARNRRTLFRDVGIRGWRDYVGWSNPLPASRRELLFGRARLQAGDDVLVDEGADFTSLGAEPPTLHVHWNGDHPAAGVYAVEEVLDAHRLRIRPAPAAGGTELAYSLGMRNYFELRIANCHFFVLDTRGHRQRHDIERPEREGLSMLGAVQKQWLLDGMRGSDADFLFVTSTVTFTIPHIAADQPEKDESWTVYLDERDELFTFFDSLDQPVLLLTGDLHNSAAVRIKDDVREYVCGPHNSPNHSSAEEGDRPPSGDFTWNDRSADIRWSTWFLPDVPGRHARRPHYVVFQVNNVFDNPGPDGNHRWIAHPRPQVVVQFYDGLTGELSYAEAVRAAPQ